MELTKYKELVTNTQETNQHFYREIEKYYEQLERNRILIKNHIPAALYNYLIQTDFFVAPASTQYHDSHVGGLAQHSINVANHLLKLVRNYNYIVSEEKVWLIAIAHDMCKIGCYKPAVRNVKTNGYWSTVMSWQYDDQEPMGHGDKSLWMLQNILKVDDDVAYSIRWHMGAFRDINSGRFEVSPAFAKQNLAMLTHIADMLATYFEGQK